MRPRPTFTDSDRPDYRRPNNRWPLVRHLRREKDRLIVDDVAALVKSFFAPPRPGSGGLLKRAAVPTRLYEGPVSARPFCTWLKNRMRYAWHPEARSFVYAYTYTTVPDLTDDEAARVKSMMNESKIDWFDGPDVVKVGTSISPDTRARAHLSNLVGHYPGLGLGRLYVRKDRRPLVVIPCRSVFGGEELESHVLGYLDGACKDDGMRGEWFRDTFGVWRALVRWFLCARAEFFKVPTRR